VTGSHRLPRDDRGPVFNEPWEARAFALTVRLHERGLFTWSEWARALAARIADERLEGGDEGSAYYFHWLDALEDLVAAKGAATREQLALCAEEWRLAAAQTPHGQAVSLTGCK
jgi:nitrile hydratase accessory protein